jgi:hypothetical protein
MLPADHNYINWKMSTFSREKKNYDDMSEIELIIVFLFW